MKYTIHGFSQKHLVELGLGGDEAMVLRWFVDFQDAGRMRAFIQDNRVYYWISYAAVLEDLPIIGGSVKTMSRRFDKLVAAGILERIVINNGRPISCFRIVETVYAPLVGDVIPVDKIVQPKTELSSGNQDNLVQPETELSNARTELSSDLITKPYKTPPRDINISLPPQGEDHDSGQPSKREMFDHFWSLYPKKRAKGEAEKAWKKIAPSNELFETILAAIKAQTGSQEWVKDGGQFIPNPATWLRAKRWLDELNPAPPPGFDDEEKFRSGRFNDVWAGKTTREVEL